MIFCGSESESLIPYIGPMYEGGVVENAGFEVLRSKGDFLFSWCIFYDQNRVSLFWIRLAFFDFFTRFPISTTIFQRSRSG